jgi:hypothetical protein
MALFSSNRRWTISNGNPFLVNSAASLSHV